MFGHCTPLPSSSWMLQCNRKCYVYEGIGFAIRHEKHCAEIAGWALRKMEKYCLWSAGAARAHWPFFLIPSALLKNKSSLIHDTQPVTSTKGPTSRQMKETKDTKEAVLLLMLRRLKEKPSHEIRKGKAPPPLLCAKTVYSAKKAVIHWTNAHSLKGKVTVNLLWVSANSPHQQRL